ncbi:sulfotransferase domain-containing protein [Fictibacillus phosphorivorans]|uniref:sulfotransferase domain-containing protein n=1 Tax=Fictibacillus phosphorivorans TaxID=1221500 RepID=UPI00203C6EEC|nr:sulfotransferase domain-containing protein [Fictibacillus phosphorivorans]MCM3719142.1 sulfotransferase domain-containing protein [Fictibacillus phosphorivorans]MCM3776764.1 sulfotransferase domain-containing protein [Fictibacillus phosphorivorans]
MIYRTKCNPFYVNTIPRSGTQLLREILLCIPRLKHDWEDQFYFEEFQKMDSSYKKYSERIKQLDNNEFAIGHLYFSHYWTDLLNEIGMKRIFLYRDPRDVVVSLVYFVLNQCRTDPFYSYLTQFCSNQRERYKAIIEGFQEDHLFFPGIVSMYRQYMNWKNDKNTLIIRFEDLLSKNRRNEMERLIDYLIPDQQKYKEEILSKMVSQVNRTDYITGKYGLIGCWKDEFDDELMERFDKLCGKVLIELGYEPSIHL